MIVTTLMAIFTAEASSQGLRLAVTVDDVPWTAAQRADSGTVARGTAELLSALARHVVPATAFVVCDALDLHPAATLEWLAQGHEIGNHSQSHRDLNNGLAPWLRDVVSCADRLAQLAPIRYFRYPLLHRGASEERYRSASDLLDSLDYTAAPVTLDNSEWLLAQAYQQAADAGDPATMDLIAATYLDHLRRVTRRSQRVTRERFGRDVPQVLLLHANQLNADHLDDLLTMLQQEFDAEFIALNRALEDPLYRLPDGYRGRAGLSWLYRAEPAQPDLARWDEEEEARLRSVILDD